MFEAWGLDPVHPTKAAYNRVADRLIEEMGSSAIVFSRKPPDAGPATGHQLQQ